MLTETSAAISQCKISSSPVKFSIVLTKTIVVWSGAENQT
jgi:hypothetical protein